MTYILPISPSVALLTLPPSRWENEGDRWEQLRWLVWLALGLLITFPLVFILFLTKWFPAKYGLSAHHTIIPLVILLAGTLTALFTFAGKGSFSQLQKVLCLTNCFFLIIALSYSAKYLGTFRSAKNIVEKCLWHEKEDYSLFSFARILPSLVFYSGKNVSEIQTNTSFKEIIFDPKKSVYLVMSLDDYQKRKSWIEKKKLRAVCQNTTHVILQRESTGKGEASDR